MKEIILIKNGEIALKGLNRGNFEDMMIRNIRRRLKSLGHFTFKKAQSTIIITPENEEIDLNEACERLKTVFGIAAFSRAAVIEKDYEAIKAAIEPVLSGVLAGYKTFRVTAKRADKRFPMKSPELERELGGEILSRFKHLSVDVHNPEVTVYIEIRELGAYLYAGKYEGAGGMPVGSSGKAMLLLSGGIDSPVAGYMMAKRGIELEAIHYVSPPYTSDRALKKVETLCKEMTPYCGRISFYCVPFTKIQEAIRDNCPEELFTLIMRRIMMIIAQRVGEQDNIGALITGESVAQVASQTLAALRTTDDVCDIPVLRPVIGMDKNEIIEIARKIGTFETSILPYEDCCTVFTPKHPRTRPKVSEVRAAHNAFDFEPLIKEAVLNTELKIIK